MEFFRPEQLTIYDQEDYSYLYQAVAHLKPDQAAVVDAYYFQALSTKETAQLLGMSQSKVKTLLLRARRALKGDLEGQGFDASLLKDHH